MQICQIWYRKRERLLRGGSKTMKKLFVSVPMKGRTEQEIKETMEKMKKIAEICEGEELELIDSYIEHNPPQNSNQAIWYLGESLKKLSEADVFIGIDNCYEWNGCEVEYRVATLYDIKLHCVKAESVIPNYRELIQEKYKAMEKTCCPM